MNKRIYMAPVLQVVSIAHQTHVLAGSPGITISDSPASQEGEVLSRSGEGFWDDDF